ncbi:MerR family DNA-binding transcriptional regulator [Microlunatus soli]|uniref:MerR family DNA-binding transcriptional regulator n=1 Tax=Microlunatus soli TaxID=630515 RepID=UPI000B8291FF
MGLGEWIGIGAFAQLSGLTVETLRHYHQVGLLVPAEVDGRTGYRRYLLRQLPRARWLSCGTSGCPWTRSRRSPAPPIGRSGARS